MHPNLRRGHDALWHRFFDARTNLIYDTPFHEPADLPTPEEVAASQPSCAGWGTGMEDCALSGGFVLDGMVAAHRVTGDEEWALKARKIFHGLVALATIHGVRGYVARGRAPGREDVYPNSSTDQYTSFVFGMWSFARSSIATDGEKAKAAELLVDIARRVEAHGGDIPRIDGRPSIYGDSSAFEEGRACRLLQVYRAAHELSGDAHWQDLYMEKVEENDRARLTCHYGPEIWPLNRNTHGVNQSQAAFHLLYKTEADPEIREAYRKALRAEALSVANRIPLWREKLRADTQQSCPPNWRTRFEAFLREHPDYDPGEAEEVQAWHAWGRAHGAEFPSTAEMEKRAILALPWLRHQTQSLVTVVLSDDEDLKRQVAGEAWAMLTEADWSLVAHAGVWECLDQCYWRGIESGMFPRE